MLTVLLATRNRSRILREVLESYCHLQSPASGWKLVVVDNGSTDQTSQVVSGFADRLPLRFVREPKPGKNVALNTGLGLVEGNLVVLTDDDAFPNSDWLIQLRKAADNEPAYAMFGGVVVPRWESPPPSWINWVNQGAVYTFTDPELREGPIDPHHVFGPNMAIRAHVFEQGIHFDTSIGPSGATYAMGSETEFVLRLGRHGYKAWHVQAAVVEHFIRKEQLQKEWVFQRAVRFGRGQYRLFGPDATDDIRPVMGVPRYLLRKLTKQFALISAGYLRFGGKSLFRARWSFNFIRGQIMEARNLFRQQSAAAPGLDRTAAS